ncbi:hypothetical protein [Streptomyces sp. NBC_01142]|nr:hypothetical protein [Streptomyces sp. NBC_01142]
MTDPAAAGRRRHGGGVPEFRLLDPAVRASPERLDELLHPDYRAGVSRG